MATRDRQQNGAIGLLHYSDVIMSAMASQITSLTIAQPFIQAQIKENIKAGLCAGNSPVTGEFPHKWPVTRKMFPFDDAMTETDTSRATSLTPGQLWTIPKIAPTSAMWLLSHYAHLPRINGMMWLHTIVNSVLPFV